MTDKPVLTEELKTTLAGLGLVSQIREAVYPDASRQDEISVLESKARTVIENLQELIVDGQLDDTDAKKLDAVLSKLRGALGSGVISREVLATALAEAANAIGAAEGNRKGQALQQQKNGLWQKVEQNNKDIDDDFEKMRHVGIVFDDKLWRKHKELSEYMQAHPQDADKQKELNGVDDLLLQQAEPQLKNCPDAKPHLEDAKKKSKERHQMVDCDLAALESSTLIVNANTKLDWSASIPADGQGKDVAINEIERPTVGYKPASKNITV